MEIKQNYLEELKAKQKEDKLESWQDYALEVIKEFGIFNRTMAITDKNGKSRIYTTNYKAIIFRQAKNNLSFLKGKVELCREKFGTKLGDKGHYLISLFRKQKPWEK